MSHISFSQVSNQSMKGSGRVFIAKLLTVSGPGALFFFNFCNAIHSTGVVKRASSVPLHSNHQRKFYRTQKSKSYYVAGMMSCPMRWKTAQPPLANNSKLEPMVTWHTLTARVSDSPYFGGGGKSTERVPVLFLKALRMPAKLGVCLL